MSSDHKYFIEVATLFQVFFLKKEMSLNISLNPNKRFIYVIY
ncbi:MAG: hypothetical protein Q8830_03190 [Candidatus Phytoplasma australasiaticum]|nr:hypothetical protein [Candidatus Phytoplasma australasiaticum]